MSIIPRLTKEALRRALPLSVRRRLAVFIGRQSWLKGRYWYSIELIRDFADRDPEGFHRFLWGNHIAYAETYEIEDRFGPEQLHPSRRLLFDQMLDFLEREGVEAGAIESVFEVGCSMGYLLRHMEHSVFPEARVLEGIDIDGYAVHTGSSVLERMGSRVELFHQDMEDLKDILKERRFDVILCAGVLMYLDQDQAEEVTSTLLDHATGLVVLTGPAYAEMDNRQLDHSVPRDRDHAFIHNLDRMVERTGGRVAFRRWDGARAVDGNTLYFVFALPAHVGRLSEALGAPAT